MSSRDSQDKKSEVAMFFDTIKRALHETEREDYAKGFRYFRKRQSVVFSLPPESLLTGNVEFFKPPKGFKLDLYRQLPNGGGYQDKFHCYVPFNVRQTAENEYTAWL